VQFDPISNVVASFENMRALKVLGIFTKIRTRQVIRSPYERATYSCFNGNSDSTFMEMSSG
jgi:hypothetical protein